MTNTFRPTVKLNNGGETSILGFGVFQTPLDETRAPSVKRRPLEDRLARRRGELQGMGRCPAADSRVAIVEKHKQDTLFAARPKLAIDGVNLVCAAIRFRVFERISPPP
jgi:hypothetical protein